MRDPHAPVPTETEPVLSAGERVGEAWAKHGELVRGGMDPNEALEQAKIGLNKSELEVFVRPFLPREEIPDDEEGPKPVVEGVEQVPVQETEDERKGRLERITKEKPRGEGEVEVAKIPYWKDGDKAIVREGRSPNWNYIEVRPGDPKRFVERDAQRNTVKDETTGRSKYTLRFWHPELEQPWLTEEQHDAAASEGENREEGETAPAVSAPGGAPVVEKKKRERVKIERPARAERPPRPEPTEEERLAGFNKVDAALKRAKERGSAPPLVSPEEKVAILARIRGEDKAPVARELEGETTEQQWQEVLGAMPKPAAQLEPTLKPVLPEVELSSAAPSPASVPESVLPKAELPEAPAIPTSDPNVERLAEELFKDVYKRTKEFLREQKQKGKQDLEHARTFVRELSPEVFKAIAQAFLAEAYRREGGPPTLQSWKLVQEMRKLSAKDFRIFRDALLEEGQERKLAQARKQEEKNTAGAGAAGTLVQRWREEREKREALGSNKKSPLGKIAALTGGLASLVYSADLGPEKVLPEPKPRPGFERMQGRPQQVATPQVVRQQITKAPTQVQEIFGPQTPIMRGDSLTRIVDRAIESKARIAGLDRIEWDEAVNILVDPLDPLEIGINSGNKNDIRAGDVLKLQILNGRIDAAIEKAKKITPAQRSVLKRIRDIGEAAVRDRNKILK